MYNNNGYYDSYQQPNQRVNQGYSGQQNPWQNYNHNYQQGYQYQNQNQNDYYRNNPKQQTNNFQHSYGNNYQYWQHHQQQQSQMQARNHYYHQQYVQQHPQNQQQWHQNRQQPQNQQIARILPQPQPQPHLQQLMQAQQQVLVKKQQPQNSQQQQQQAFKKPHPHPMNSKNRNAKHMKPSSPQQTPRDSSSSSRDGNSRDSSIERKKNMVETSRTVSEDRSTEWDKAFDEAMTALQSADDGNEVKALRSKLQYSRSDWNDLKNNVFNDLSESLKSLDINEIMMFGSAITELDLVGSDIDFFVQLNKIKNDMPTIMNRATKLLRNYQNFDVLCRILQARVPIIKAVHMDTKTMCDINFSSGFGYFNSCFISQILNSDERFKEVALILKLWSKSYKVTERMRLTSYCMVMMLFFYLQNMEKPMLTSIKKAQEGLPPVILDKTLSWDFSYDTKAMTNLNKTENEKLTTRDLLEGFFEFWLNFDSKENIASLYLGIPIKRTELENHPDLEDYRRIVKRESLRPFMTEPKHLIVQDGFELNLNIAFKNGKNWEEFQKWLQFTVKKVNELKSEKFSTMLHKLFTDVKPATKEEFKRKTPDKKMEMKIFPSEGDLKVIKDILVKRDSTKVYDSREINKFYAESAVKSIIKLLEEIYLAKVTTIKEEFTDEWLMNEYHLLIEIDTVTGRKKMNLNSDEKIQNEIFISTERSHMPLNKAFDLDAVMQIASNNGFKSIELTFLDRSNKKKSPFLQFTTYFSINLCAAVKCLLKLVHKT